MRLGILCGGGPAPGINSVISAATIEACNSRWEVVGILDGFEHLIQGDATHVLPLEITDVSRIHVLGGSILFTSRANPTMLDDGAEHPDWRMRNTVRALKELGIDALVTIGGDDTAFSAQKVAEAAGDRSGWPTSRRPSITISLCPGAPPRSASRPRVTSALSWSTI